MSDLPAVAAALRMEPVNLSAVAEAQGLTLAGIQAPAHLLGSLLLMALLKALVIA